MEEKRRRLMGKSGGVPTIVPPTPKTGLTYNGSAQELVDAGSTDIGVLIYSTDNENWSSSIPTGTNAGSYTVYYKVQGFEAEYVSCSIAKASRTISFTTKPSSVNVNASKTVTATPSAGSGDGTITYSSGKTSIATVSGSSVTGKAKGSATIYATVSEGTNYLSASTSYTISVVYSTGVYAIYSDGTIKSNGTSSAVGVLVVTSSYTFIIDKSQNTGRQSYSNSSSYVSKRSVTINGSKKTGTLGTKAQWSAAYSNKSSVVSMMSSIGGTAFDTSVPYYWTNTSSGINYYRINWNTGATDAVNQSGNLWSRAIFSA